MSQSVQDWGRLALAGVLLASLPASAGCGLRERMRSFFEDEKRSAVALRIGESSYSRADLDRFFDSRLSEFRNPAEADQVKSNLLEAFIEDRLVLHEAERRGVEADPRALKALLDGIAAGSADQPGGADARRDPELVRGLTESLKSQRYLRTHLLGGIEVPDAECESYYMAHIGDYVVNDLVRLREILVDEKSQAERILDMLKKNRNKNFAELARSFSKAASAPDGGEMGTFQRGDLPEEFEKVVFPMGPGSVSRPVRTRYGYHIFLVEERIPAHQQKLWEVIEQIRDRLKSERERELIDREITRLASQTPVHIERQSLGFSYIGRRFPSP